MSEKLKHIEIKNESKIASFFRNKYTQLFATIFALGVSINISYEAGRKHEKETKKTPIEILLKQKEEEIKDKLNKEFPHKYKSKTALGATCWDIGSLEICPKKVCKKQNNIQEHQLEDDSVTDEETAKKKVESDLTEEKIDGLMNELEELNVDLNLDKFKYTTKDTDLYNGEFRSLLEDESSIDNSYRDKFLNSQTEDERKEIICEYFREQQQMIENNSEDKKIEEEIKKLYNMENKKTLLEIMLKLSNIKDVTKCFPE